MMLFSAIFHPSPVDVFHDKNIFTGIFWTLFWLVVAATTVHMYFRFKRAAPPAPSAPPATSAANPAVPPSPAPTFASILMKPTSRLGKILQTTVLALAVLWFLLLSLVFARVIDRNNPPLNYFGTAYSLLVAAFCVEMFFRAKRATTWNPHRFFPFSKKAFMAFWAAFFIGCIYLFVTAVYTGPVPKPPAPDAPALDIADFVDEQTTAHAQAGDKGAQYHLWESYYKGAYNVKPDSVRAGKWLQRFVDGIYVVRFEAAEGFRPQNAHEYLGEIDRLTPEVTTYKNGLTMGCFFRTTKTGDKLTATFLTAQPDELTACIKKNPNLKFISVERMTPEKFVEYDNSPQESLDSTPEQPSGNLALPD